MKLIEGSLEITQSIYPCDPHFYVVGKIWVTPTCKNQVTIAKCASLEEARSALAKARGES